MNGSKPPFPRPPLFMLIFVSMFGFIGLALLISLWSKSSHEFGAPPLFFRLFGSCIAIAFMAVGFGIPITALRRRAAPRSGDPDQAGPPPATSGGAGYQCPNCGAALGPEQEVSPSGDAKCGYCRKWWNIHRA